jgi:hypothetical protein
MQRNQEELIEKASWLSSTVGFSRRYFYQARPLELVANMQQSSAFGWSAFVHSAAA